MIKNTIVDADAEALLQRAHTLESETETKALYQDWASTYDKTMIEGLGYLSPVKAANLLADHLSSKSAQILDVGTGTGLVGSELFKLGFTNIDGIDYSAPMLKMARKTGAYGKLLEADINRKLEIETGIYDALICIGTFTHGHIGADCLDELFRVMASGGLFVTAIRKNYWHPAGFAVKVDQLTTEEKIKTVTREEESNYTTSTEPESWFVVWEKL